ncbi:hypothetical protein ES705_32111 [subsurface metagenome]
MEKRKYLTPSTYKSVDSEKNTGPSVTVPGQSYSVAELLNRHIAGNMPDVKRQEYYDPEASFDNMDPTENPDFDLSDATVLADEIKIKIEEQKEKKKEKDEKDKKEKDQQKETEIWDRAKKDLKDEKQSAEDVKDKKEADPDKK